jgi:hypothetical protein
MSEWWTYRLESFLLFSERAYWRLFELHDAAVWPAQFVAILLGVAVAVLVLRPNAWSGRAIALILAAAWAFVGWGFLWNSYATINWAASYIAPLFALQAMLLAWIGMRGGLSFDARVFAVRAAGLLLLLYAVAVHPLVGLIAGRPIAASEVFGVTPDPMAIATLGLLVLAQVRARAWALLAAPLAWCLFSGATLYTMGTWQASVPLGAAALALAVMAARGMHRAAAAR